MEIARMFEVRDLCEKLRLWSPVGIAPEVWKTYEEFRPMLSRLLSTRDLTEIIKTIEVFERLEYLLKQIPAIRALEHRNVVVVAVTEDDRAMAEGIARTIGARMCEIIPTRFPNGVPEPTFADSIRGKTVVVVGSVVGNPIEKQMLLEMTVRAARDSHAGYILVIIPYSSWWRSDKKDKGGMATGGKFIAEKIELAGANHVIVCDLHNDAVGNSFTAPDVITVQSVLLRRLRELGTVQALAQADVGAGKRTKVAAKFLGVPYGTADKSREGRRDKVDITGVYGVDYKGLGVGIPEDEILTGGTVGEIGWWLVNIAGAKEVWVSCSHAPFLYVEGALQKLSGVKVITTNTVPFPANPTPELLARIQDGSIVIVDVSSEIFGDAVNRFLDKVSFGSLHSFRQDIG